MGPYKRNMFNEFNPNNSGYLTERAVNFCCVWLLTQQPHTVLWGMLFRWGTTISQMRWDGVNFNFQQYRTPLWLTIYCTSRGDNEPCNHQIGAWGWPSWAAPHSQTSKNSPCQRASAPVGHALSTILIRAMQTCRRPARPWASAEQTAKLSSLAGSPQHVFQLYSLVIIIII